MIAGDTLNNISALLGEEIRKRRTALGMSQEELGYKSGISAAHLGQIERALKTVRFFFHRFAKIRRVKNDV